MQNTTNGVSNMADEVAKKRTTKGKPKKKKPVVSKASSEFCDFYFHNETLPMPSLGSRIRYTCIHASPHFFACGASTGGVYLYAWEGGLGSNPLQLQLTNMITVDEQGVRDPISCVQFSPNEGYLAVATTAGLIRIVEITGLRHHEPAQVVKSIPVYKV